MDGTEKALMALSLEESFSVEWDAEEKIGRISKEKGSFWSGMGYNSRGTTYVHVEEMLYLLEFCEYSLKSDSKKDDDSFLLKELRLNQLELRIYEVYKQLRRLGYIVLRPENPYLNQERISAEDRIEFSIFRPNSSFRKTKPEGLIGRLLEFRSSDNVTNCIELLERLGDEVGIIYCRDNPGSENFVKARILDPRPEANDTDKSRLKSKKYPGTKSSTRLPQSKVSQESPR